MKRIINILLLLLFVQTITFAQGVGVDSVQVVNALADTCFNNTIADSVKLKSVPFETIEREGGKYYAVTSDGHKEEITSFINGRKRVMVKDDEGHELVIDKDGNVMGVEEYKKCGGSAKLLQEYNAHRDSTMSASGNITFSKIKEETYGFDYWRGADYDKDVYDNFNGYRPTYIGAQKQSNIKVKASQTKGVRFITERGVPIIANTADNTLNLAIGTAGKQTVYAYRDSTLVGKLCILAYDVKEVKVHVVRVNNGKQLELNKIADEVNRIYSSAIVHYTFDELDPIKIEYANKQHFVHGGKGTFQNYNTDQKTAIKALPETADPNDYYLFFTDCYNRLDTAGNTSKEAVNGYMPVGRHYGFIYNEYDNARTIAHELGHGTNSLHHTFSDDSESFHTTAKTDNLMDYHAGDYLNHRQWQWAHEKHRNVLGFLDDEEESEQKIKESPLQKMGLVYMTEKWEQGTTYSSEEACLGPDDYLNGIANETLRNAINKYVSKTESFKSIKELLSTKQNVIRIVDRNTIQDQRGSTYMMGCNKRTKKVDYVERIASKMFAAPDNYYLIDIVYMYTESFKIKELSENERMMLMTIVLGHELFIHYNHIKAISLWQQGKYKEALDYATKDTGPNNGDYNHKDYINGNKTDEGIAMMYKYLNELQQIIEAEKTSVTKKDFNKAKEEHDKSYKRLKNKKQ